MGAAWWAASDAVARDDACGGQLADLGGDLCPVIDGGVVGEASTGDDGGAAGDDDAHA